MIYCLGQDPFDRSAASRSLLNTLLKLGFRKSELEYAAELPEEECHALVFGSKALAEVFPDLRMGEVIGEILFKDKAIIVATYAPGFLYHNPEKKGLWEDHLTNALVAFQLDQKGVIA